MEDVKKFLCDVLVHTSFDDISDVARFFNSGGLSYQQLLMDARLHESIRVNHVCKQVFGLACPWPIMNMILNQKQSLLSSTFLQFLSADSAVVKEYHRIESESYSYMHNLRHQIAPLLIECKKYLYQRWFVNPESIPNELTLFKAFLARNIHASTSDVELLFGSQMLDYSVIRNSSLCTFDVFGCLFMRDFNLHRIVIDADVIVVDELVDTDCLDRFSVIEFIRTLCGQLKSKKIIVAPPHIHSLLKTSLAVCYTPIYTHPSISVNVMLRFHVGDTHLVTTSSSRSIEIANIWSQISVNSFIYLTDDMDSLLKTPNIPQSVQFLIQPNASVSALTDLVKKYWNHCIIPLDMFSLSTAYLKMNLEWMKNRMNKRLGLKALFYRSLLPYLLKSIEDETRYASSDKCILVIDNRENALSLMSVMVAHLFLHTDIVIATASTNFHYYKSMVNQYLPHVKLTLISHPLLEQPYFDIDAYNVLLKDSSFWKSILPYEHCMLVQDDGFVLDSNIANFFKYDYVGAPWIVCEGNNELQSMCPHMVGNGGLSIRSIPMMIRITETYQREKNQPFNNLLQPIPEDVYFSLLVKRDGGNIPNAPEAATFACEEDFNIDANGVHKFWVYCSESNIIALCEKLIGKV